MPILIFLILLLQSLAGSTQSFSLSSLRISVPQVDCTPVKDQFLSSTCWAFSSNSLLESEWKRKSGQEIDLSEMFIARYSLVRKIERHLALKGANYFTPGGQFHDEVWVIKNYGIVPEEVYNGRPRGEWQHNHAELDTLLGQFVRSCLQYGITRLDSEQRLMLDSALDFYLGRVPSQFYYRGKYYTPKTFASGFLHFNPDDYAEITSYTHHPFYQSFVLEDKYNWSGDSYFNVPLDDFSRITDQALQQGFTVGWDGDADDPFFNFYEGLAWLPDSIPDNQASRQQAFANQSTLLNHMMHIVAVTQDRYGKKWYYLKNSWGDGSNPLGGFLLMRSDYFRIRTVAIIVNKKAIPSDIREKLFTQ